MEMNPVTLTSIKNFVDKFTGEGYIIPKYFKDHLEEYVAEIYAKGSKFAGQTAYERIFIPL